MPDRGPYDRPTHAGPAAVPAAVAVEAPPAAVVVMMMMMWAARGDGQGPTERMARAASSAATVADQPLSSVEPGRPARARAWSRV